MVKRIIWSTNNGQVANLSSIIGIEARKIPIYYFSWKKIPEYEKSQICSRGLLFTHLQ